jgi:tRNA-dihydrouridine synthase
MLFWAKLKKVIKIMPRIILAPLQGVTTPLFRTLFVANYTGCNEAMAPFISISSGGKPPLSHIKELLTENNSNRMTLIPQLLSKDGNDFLSAAKVICDATGSREINWNIGCPSGTVTGKKRGAGLLPHPDIIDRFLNVVCASMPCRLSIKMRLGMKSSREWEPLAPILNRYPISEITIHARTGVQKYDGVANTEMFAEIKAALRHPIVYNGDITTVEFAKEIMKRHPDLSGIMVGRGLVANPLLADSIQNGSEANNEAIVQAILKLHDIIFEGYSKFLQGGALLGRMKELVKYWGPKLTDDERAIRNVLRSRSVEEYRSNFFKI